VSTGLAVLESDQARARGLIAEGTFLVLAVTDDGQGMTADMQAMAFDPFFTTKPAGEGTGLGLAMCASIVRRAGGFIAVESAPGQGSTFRVYLPVAGFANDAARHSSPKSTAVANQGPTVLVVEDNEAIRNLVSRVLSSRGLSVLEARDLATARRLLADRHVDLLLTDGMLPDGRGPELAAESVAKGQVERVVLMSGSEAASDPSVNAVVPKPFRTEALVATVLAVLGRDPDGPPPAAHPLGPQPAG
jgi:CheY-like chemotaxis protein